MNSSSGQLAVLQQEVIACRRCPRLVEYIAEIGRVKRRAYRDWDYWAKPVPSFGDPKARVLILGLAPGAHGSNRTGRPFTGDASGAILYRVLYRAGFASQPESRSRDDDLRLTGAYITAVGALRSAGQQADDRRTAQLPSVPGARAGVADQSESRGGAGKDCV